MRLSGPVVSVAVLLFAGCGGAMGPANPTALASVAAREVSPRQSCAQPNAGKKSALIYGGDWATNDVFDSHYLNCKQAGELMGFSEPYGMCVDAKGDIYIASFGAGNVVEYAHGGSTLLNTYSSGGEPVGCSVDAKGDVAVTSFSPAEEVVFAEGDPSKSTTYTGPCTYLWTMGYDEKGNLVGMGTDSSGGVIACGIRSGSKSMTTLNSDFSEYFPGGTMWDGKYLAIDDQEWSSGFEDRIIQATLSGNTLVEKGETLLECSKGYPSGEFIVGKKNTPVNREQGKVVLGSCGDGLAYWHYPAGGYPFKACGVAAETYGFAVSLKP